MTEISSAVTDGRRGVDRSVSAAAASGIAVSTSATIERGASAGATSQIDTAGVSALARSAGLYAEPDIDVDGLVTHIRGASPTSWARTTLELPRRPVVIVGARGAPAVETFKNPKPLANVVSDKSISIGYDVKLTPGTRVTFHSTFSERNKPADQRSVIAIVTSPNKTDTYTQGNGLHRTSAGAYSVEHTCKEAGDHVVKFIGDRGWSTHQVYTVQPIGFTAAVSQPTPEMHSDSPDETMVRELGARGIPTIGRSAAFVRAAHAELRRRAR